MKPKKLKRYEKYAKLKTEIDKLYLDKDIDDIESDEADYEKSITKMVTVTKIEPKGVTLMDLFEDIEFKPVIFPEVLTALLSRNDTFLATLGFKDQRWHIIYLSPPYDESMVSD